MRAVVVVRLADRCLPQAGDDLELFLVAVEAFAGVRKGNSIGSVLGLEPACPQAELHPPTTHLVHLGDLDRQDPGVAEGRARHQRPEPDPVGVASQPGERGPGVGRAGEAVTAHGEVVIRAEERSESEVLGRPRDSEQVVVRRALLGFGEDAQLHEASLPCAGEPVVERSVGAHRLRHVSRR